MMMEINLHQKLESCFCLSDYTAEYLKQFVYQFCINLQTNLALHRENVGTPSGALWLSHDGYNFQKSSFVKNQSEISSD